MNKQQGFTLIEVLIAVVILAGGLLGLAGLQATGVRNNLAAYQESQAQQLANDIADRMRLNYNKASDYQVTSTDLATKTCANVVSGQCVACKTSANTCDPTALKNRDLYDWRMALANNLPSGTGSIVKNGSQYTISVIWDRDRNGSTANDASFALIFTL